MLPPRVFRPARARSTRANLAWTLLQSALVWGIALAALPAVILAVESGLGIRRVELLHQPVAAAFFFSFFSVLNLTTGFTLAARGRGTPLPSAAPRELVISGPYRFVRNPMAIAGVGQGVAIALWFGSILVLAYAVAGAILWHWLIRPDEERDLRGRFGTTYDVYRAAVPLWWPRRSPIDIREK